jgi:histone-lysine N-methyltransferase SETD2
MECVGDCSCGTGCQNRRFQHKQYADVAVIKTEKKGYGLRANTDLRPNDFIFEYIGEVIGENVFRRRMQQYDEEGIKHFYFMSLTKGEFVDATKRGNLGRFCNHSCNPNCYVDKWVVGDRLRMGVFAERKIEAGEELVFNYNVDRYGADPQPCYCGEPNCTGYIGGKTQTERGTKLSNAIIEALGIEDAEAWDTAVAKRPRKKKAGEDDEEYVNNVEPRGLDEEGVNKVMSSLMQCKEKWIAVKLLTRIQRAEDDRVRNRVVRFHGYRILKTALTNFKDDVNVCIQILDILDKMPRLTRNKIQDSNIESTITELAAVENQGVASRAQALVDAWAKLEIAYRIPRVKRDPNAALPDRKLDRLERRGEDRRRSKSRTRSPERIHAPTGPRNNAPSRPSAFFSNPRPSRPRPTAPMGALPVGWFEATAANGSKYYYNQTGDTTWQRPTMPTLSAPPPPPPKVVSDQQVLSDLIKNIVSSKKESSKNPSATATPVETPKKERKEDKWRSLPEDKQKKLYESALQPHIMHVVGKFKHKLPKDDLKRWAKEFAKQVVNSDFKKKRVEDVHKISDKKAKEVKKHAQVFFDKAVKKKGAAEKKKVEKKALKEQDGDAAVGSPQADEGSPTLEDIEEALSDHDIEENGAEATPAESTDSFMVKRRRDDEVTDDETAEQLLKRQRVELEDAPPPPPPPPPPAETGLSNGADGEETDVVAAVISGDQDHQLSNGGDDFDAHSATGLIGVTISKPDLEPSQVATPPTTGSPDQGDAEIEK